MSFIPYPAVPKQPGVPPVPRIAPGNATISMPIAPPANTVSHTSNSEPSWGIYLPSGAPIYTPTQGGTLSVISFGMSREMQVLDFPVEPNSPTQGAGFAAFNKVFTPYNPVITYAMSGTESEKSAFLTVIDAACSSTSLFNVYTPEMNYAASNGACTVERYGYQRSATRGATLLIVEVSLKQALEVTAAIGNVQPGVSFLAPMSPSSSSAVSNGNTQTSTSNLTSSQFLSNGAPVGVNKCKNCTFSQ